MSSTNPFDAHVASQKPSAPSTPAGGVLAALIEEALGGPAATPAAAPAAATRPARKRPSGKHWSAAENDAHYAAVVAAMLDDDLSFDDACARVASEVKRQRSAFRSAMVVVARREKATRLLGV